MNKQTNLKDIVQDVKRHEALRKKSELCGQSWVQPTNAIVLNGVAHAGVASHVCALPAKHDGVCRCECRVVSLQR